MSRLYSILLHVVMLITTTPGTPSECSQTPPTTTSFSPLTWAQWEYLKRSTQWKSHQRVSLAETWEFGYGVWGTTDLGTGGGCTSILSQQKPLSVGVRITVSSRGTPALLSPPNTTPPPLYEHAEWEWRASGATPSTGICKWHPVVMYESCARYVLAPYLYSWNLLNDSFKIYLTYLICGGLYAYGPCVMW